MRKPSEAGVEGFETEAIFFFEATGSEVTEIMVWKAGSQGRTERTELRKEAFRNSVSSLPDFHIQSLPSLNR
jgi:hypothetical protein